MTALRLHASTRVACGLVLTLISASVPGEAAYEVRLQSELNGLDVKVATIENPGGLIVRLTNDSAQKIRCTLRLDAQPQPLARKTVYVDAGKTEDAAFAAKRKWFDVDVRLECDPAG